MKLHDTIWLVMALLALGAPAWGQDTLIVEGDKVGINTSEPTAKLHVLLGGTPFAVHSQTAMAFQNTTDSNSGVIFSLIGGDGSAGNGQINFGTTSNEFAGRIVYSFGPNAMRFFVNGSERARITADGNLGIGTSTPAGALDVNGPIYQRGGVVHADFVFDPDYELESIQEHAEYMWTNRHLPAVGPGLYDEEGRSITELGSRTAGMLEELEKAHIYIEQLSERLAAKDRELERLTERLTRIEKRLAN